MNKKVLCLLLFVLILDKVTAQKKRGDYDFLLWRISGKGLQKPSYVFGTMHLTDKRLFHFTDSLYRSLETSDGFAAELDMDAMMPQIVSEINSERDLDKKINKLVRAEWLKPHQSKLEKVTKKSLDEITLRDIKKIKSNNTSQLIRQGEMNTIMDIYLFDIARRQGKWVGGIEDMEDQLKVDENEEEEAMSMIYSATTDVSQTKKSLEWMIKTYLKQDLSAIDLTSDLWKGAEKEILIRRNIKMARRMDSLMQIRTCLFAVGAAHIPGDSGVVTLLRGRGFTVEPVYTSKTIAPEKYVYIQKEIPWVAVQVKDDWYRLQMPGKPEHMEFDTDISLDAKFYMDLTRMNAYFTFSVPIPANGKKNTDSLYKGMAENIARKGKIISEKVITVNGNSGKEFVIKVEDSDMRIQIFIPGSAVVMNMLAANKKDSLYGADANKFFQSFQIDKPAPVSPMTSAASWKTYSFSRHAFSIQYPKEYKNHPRDTKVDTIWRTNIYTSTDLNSQLSCWVVVMEAKSGYYSDSDSAYFEQLRANVSEMANATTRYARAISIEGFPASEFKMVMEYEKQGLEILARVVNRGNRRYYYYAVYPLADSTKPEAEKFLNSFKFLPMPEQQWSRQVSPGNDISLWSPSSIISQKPDGNSETADGFLLYDSVSPVTILIDKEGLNTYSWWSSDSAFFKARSGLYIRDGDSLLSYRSIQKGKLKGADFSIKVNDNHNLKKVQLWLNGDTLYSLYAFMPPELLLSPGYSSLFSEVQFINEHVSSDHLVNKTTRILKEMLDGDSATFEAAVNAIEDAPFTSTDLPQLQKALLSLYRDYDPEGYCAHDKLINKVLEIDDGSTKDFIGKNYNQLNAEKEILKYPFLSILFRLKTKESFNLARQLLIENKPPKTSNSFNLRYGLFDSLELTASLFPDILSQTTDTGFIKIFPGILNELLDSGLVAINTLQPFKKNFYEFANRELKRINNEKGNYERNGIELVDLLAHFKEPAAYQLMQQFLRAPVIEVKEAAAIALLKKGQAVDASQIEKIAASDAYRISLYEQLKELKKEKLFPAKYRTQQFMAKSEVYSIASDDMEPSSVVYLTDKNVSFMGKQQKFYLYKVTYDYGEGEKESFLAVAGPYKNGAEKLIIDSDVCGINSDEEFDAKKVNEQLRQLLDQWEEYLKKDEFKK